MRCRGRVKGLSSLQRVLCTRDVYMTGQTAEREISWVLDMFTELKRFRFMSLSHSGICSLLDTGKSLHSPPGIRDGLLLLLCSLDNIPVVSGKCHGFLVTISAFSNTKIFALSHCFLFWSHVSAEILEDFAFYLSCYWKKNPKQAYLRWVFCYLTAAVPFRSPLHKSDTFQPFGTWH